MQPLQTENARISLSTKLIQLKKFDIAMKELRMLKLRLQLAMSGRVSADNWLQELQADDAALRASGRPVSKTKTAQPDGESLIEFSQIQPTSSAFPLLISYQLGVLRCVAGLKRSELIEVGILSRLHGVKAHVVRQSSLHYHHRAVHST